MSYIIKGADDKPILHQGKEIHAVDLIGVVKGVDLEKRLLKITGTDETRDRDGDVVKVTGWMLENYQKNPVFLWAHDYRSVPLAAAQKVVRKRNPASLEFHLRFPTEGLYPFADMILNLYHESIINASSVGFIPFKWEDLTDEEKDGMSPMAEVFGGRKFVKQELLELSGCAVPSNPNALQNALKSFGKQHNLQVDESKVMDYLLKGMPQDVMEVKEDDVLEDLKIGKCDIEDESEPKVHQVPEELEAGIDKGEDTDTGLIEEVAKEEVLKPYPNEHACRLNDPSKYDKFRRSKRKHDGKEYSVIYGKKKDSDTWEEQAYRYNKETWDAGAARSHCSNHNGSFEAASSSALEGWEEAKVGLYMDSLLMKNLQDGEYTFYGFYDNETKNVVLTQGSKHMDLEEAEKFVRESYSKEFGVDLSEGEFTVQETRWVQEMPESKTVVKYFAFSNGRLQLIRSEVYDSKDLEPVGKPGAVLSRTNREKLSHARDILEEVLKEAQAPADEVAGEEVPDKTGAGVTTDEFQDVMKALEEVKNQIIKLNESFGG